MHIDHKIKHTIYNTCRKKLGSTLLLSFLLTSFMVILTNCESKKEESKLNPISQVLNPSIKKRPNILWIVAEDMSPNIPSFGDSTVVTPNLSRLAAEGVCYDNFFTPHPVCAPARASIITGMYANSIGASHMRTGPWFSDTVSEETIANYKSLPKENIPYEAVPPPEIKMFTEYLRTAGYYCTNNKKEDYQFRKTMTAWDESSDKAHWRNRPENTPFFSVFNLNVTHESQIWAKANDSLWVDEELNVPIPPYLPDTKVGRKDVRRMYSNILEMDAQVGALLSQLEADGLMENTLVFWYTDHGGPLPRQKRVLYDSGTKVPMIVRFPNKEFAGMRDARMVSFVDLAPTTLSLAGIEPPEHMQGSAFLGQHLRTKEPELVYGAADRFDEFTDHIRSVRNTEFLYIKNFNTSIPTYSDVAYRKQMRIMQELLRLEQVDSLSAEQALWFQQPKPKEELYDVINDPHQVNNLAQNPKYHKQLIALRKECENWVAQIDDKGLQPESELVDQFWPNKKQPLTSNPQFQMENGQLHIQCNTDGASIGYRFINGQPQNNWFIYTKPIKIEEGIKLEAVAHRIGYKRSNTRTWPQE